MIVHQHVRQMISKSILTSLSPILMHVDVATYFLLRCSIRVVHFQFDIFPMKFVSLMIRRNTICQSYPLSLSRSWCFYIILFRSTRRFIISCTECSIAHDMVALASEAECWNEYWWLSRTYSLSPKLLRLNWARVMCNEFLLYELNMSRCGQTLEHPDVSLTGFYSIFFFFR